VPEPIVPCMDDSEVLYRLRVRSFRRRRFRREIGIPEVVGIEEDGEGFRVELVITFLAAQIFVATHFELVPEGV
jgi:hypothetical protein